MDTKLLGVMHSLGLKQDYLNEAISVLKELEAGQKVAIELGSEELAFLNEVCEKKEVKSEIASWAEKRVIEFAKDRGKEYGLNKFEIELILVGSKGKEALRRTTNELYNQLLFYNELVKFLKKRGAKCIPIDSKVAKRRIEALETSYKSLYISYPLREKFFVQKIMKTKPDYVVLGTLHVKEIKMLLGRNKFRSEIVLKQKIPGKKRLLAPALKGFLYLLRSNYKRRRKKKQVVRKKKFARRI